MRGNISGIFSPVYLFTAADHRRLVLSETAELIPSDESRRVLWSWLQGLHVFGPYSGGRVLVFGYAVALSVLYLLR